MKYGRYRIKGLIKKHLFYVFALCVFPLFNLFYFFFCGLYNHIFLICINIILVFILSILLVGFFNKLKFKMIYNKSIGIDINIQKIKHYFDSICVPFDKLCKNVYCIQSVNLDRKNRKEMVLFIFTEEGVLINKVFTDSLFFNFRLVLNNNKFNAIINDTKQILN